MSLLGILGGAVKGALGIATGGVSNVILGGIGSIVKGASKTPTITPGTGMPKIGTALRLPVSVPSALMPKPWTDSTVVSGVNLGGAGGVTIGKTTTYTAGVTGGSSSTAPMRTYKKIRRMNPANTKALRKAIRRVTAFQKLARQVGFSRPPAKLRGVHNPRRRS